MFQPEPILQSHLIDPPWTLPNGLRLPGTSPIGAADWWRVDDVYEQQMRLRDTLVQARPDSVHALKFSAVAAAQEALEIFLNELQLNKSFHVTPTHVTRPDNIKVAIDTAQPLKTLGRLFQEDFCILEKQGDEHVLTAAILCFPASWSLGEKFGKPLSGIHAPVDEYDENVTKRVQRLFNAIRVGQPIIRANCLPYHDFALYQPRRENERRIRPDGAADYTRVERQCLFRLPDSKAVVFSIHTSVVRTSQMSVFERKALSEYLSK